MTEPARPTLKARPKSAPTNAELLPLDIQDLMQKPQFLRFMLTVFDVAGMFTAASTSKTEPLQMVEGRRGLGFDMLRNLERYSGHDALVRILAMREPPKEATNGRRNDPDRYLDDGNVDGADDDRTAGERFLDYGDDD